MERVCGVHHVILGTPDVARAGRFYREVWRMESVDQPDANEQWFRSAATAHVEVRLRQAAAPSFEGVVFALRSMPSLNAVAAKLTAAGHSVSPPDDIPAGLAGMGLVMTTDPDGNRVGLVLAKEHALDATATTDGPRKLGHVVLRAVKFAEMEAFYSQLGLAVCDRTAHVSFMRCNTDHHSFALVRSTDRTGLQHLAFDVGSLDTLMRNRARLERSGTDCLWGPGRHGPGNNIFTYYHDPDGRNLEFYCDMQTFEDTEVREVKVWGPEHGGDIWGGAGPLPTELR